MSASKLSRPARFSAEQRCALPVASRRMLQVWPVIRKMIAMTALVTMAIDWESAASVGVKARTIATPWRAETGSREFRKEQ
jgi:hypothetical protein